MVINKYSSFILIQRTLISLLSSSYVRTISNVSNRFLKVDNFSRLSDTTEFYSHDCLSLVQSLGDFKGSNYGESVHCLFIKTGFKSDVFVQNNLMKFYSNQGNLRSTHKVFDEIAEPNLISWTTMISSYVHDGQYNLGVSMFRLMIRSGLRPNEFGFSLSLKACRILKDFVTGVVIHGQVLKSGFDSDPFCVSSILGIYLDCGKLEDGEMFFDAVLPEKRSEASWNMLIDSFVQVGDIDESVKLFQKMMLFDVSPSSFTYSIILKLCANMVIPHLARSIHGQTMKLGLQDDVVVGFALVDAYAKLGFVDSASRIFRNLKEKDNVVWCSLLSGYQQIGDSIEGLKLYHVFLSEGNSPDSFTFSIALSLCSNLDNGCVGSQIHCGLVKHGFVLDSILGSSLINMYGNLGNVSDAYKCFDEVRPKDDICFSAMINTLVLNLYNELALQLFLEMRESGFEPSQSTIGYILQALGDLDMLKHGKSVHSRVLKSHGDSVSRLSMENALIEMYGKCMDVNNAENVFKEMKSRNEYSWTTLMSSFIQSGRLDEVLGLFRGMFLGSVLEKPSRFTIVSVLQACTKLEALSRGKQVHGYAIKAGFSSQPFIESSLIAMYSTSKTEIRGAFRAFSLMKKRDLVSWSAMLTACVQNGYYSEALDHFVECHRAMPDFSFDESIFSTCLSACAGLAAMDIGKSFHGCVIKMGLDSNLCVVSSIIDMYSKCGYINEARELFNEKEDQDHNLVTFTAMISGYAYNGLGSESVKLFHEMKEIGLKPDGITFIGVLSACSHAGLVSEGWEFFNSMRTNYSLEATISHYACIVDLLGRNEQVELAEILIENATFELAKKYLLWRTLLGACHAHGNIEVGNRIAQKMLELRPREPSTYVLLSNMYASALMWDDSIDVRRKMREVNVVKQPGSSWIRLS